MSKTKLSDVIRHLQLLKDKYGDLGVKRIEVTVPDGNGWVVQVPSPDWKPESEG